MENYFLDCTCRVRSGRISHVETRYAPNMAEISRQAFVLARSQYSSGSPLYFVRGGSETILSDTEVHSVQKALCNFELGRDAEVDGRGKITFQAVYRHTPGKDFPPSIEICARTNQNFLVDAE